MGVEVREYRADAIGGYWSHQDGNTRWVDTKPTESAWEDCGEAGWEACVDGELKAIKHYMREKGLPWSFARVAFSMGLAAYMTAKRELPGFIPEPLSGQ